MSFSEDIEKFAKKCGKSSDTVVRGILMKIGESLVNKTPVGDATHWEHPESAPPGYVGGHARASWSYSEGVLVSQEFADIDKAKWEEFNVSQVRIMAAMPKKAAGKVHYIQNSVPYIQALEDGHSRQAAGPHAIVGRTKIEFQGIIRDAVAGVK